MSSSLVSGGAVNTTAAPGSFDDICALSPLQQEIFSDPDHAEYTEQALWSNSSPLDDETLKRSWDLLAQRHPILRTLFRQARKQTVQIIRANARVSLAFHNLNHEAEARQQEVLQRVIRQELMVPFDLGKGPLFRVNVFRLSDSSFKTLLTFHPILMDRQSVEMIHLEASDIYDALTKGEIPAEQEKSTIQEFILWLKRQDSTDASRYWERHLAGASITHFPPENSSDSHEKTHTQRDRTFSPDSTTAITALAAQCGVSVPVVLQGAWAALLSRYAGTSDVTFGLNLDGRVSGLNGNQKIAGKFAHTLPAHLQIQPNKTVTDLLHALQQQIINVNRYNFLPLSQVAGTVPSAGKLFNTVFKEPGSGGRATTDLQFVSGQPRESALAGLMVEVIQGESLRTLIHFQEGSFNPATVECLLASFHHLVEGMVAN
ncbi:MAG TPA: condensation domain-containing protein, partial [Candidatus Angelobacter sp.]|nr:condensation domain-containing protein [Candidatus Angelobacter sp.]